MSLSDKSFLITGAAGFIGSHLSNRLVSLGAHVQGLDSYIHASSNPLSFPCEKGDIRWDDLLLMRMKDVDTVIHLAAMVNVDYSATMPTYVFDVNLDGTLSVLETARRLDKSVVFASSSEVYGTCQTTKHGGASFYHTRASAMWEETKAEMDACPNCQIGSGFMSEDHPLDGQSPYAASKIAADRACKAWKHAYGMDINIVRLFNVMGPYQASDGYGGVIARFTKCALDARPMPIFGDGSQRRDYTYIDDAVDAYLLALTKKFDGPINFGGGTTVSISEVAVDISYAVDAPVNIQHIEPRAGEVSCLRADASKARALGWGPKVSFKEGLTRYIQWAKSN